MVYRLRQAVVVLAHLVPSCGEIWEAHSSIALWQAWCCCCQCKVRHQNLIYIFKCYCNYESVAVFSLIICVDPLFENNEEFLKKKRQSVPPAKHGYTVTSHDLAIICYRW